MDKNPKKSKIAGAVTQGSLIVGNATPKWDELTKTKGR